MHSFIFKRHKVEILLILILVINFFVRLQNLTFPFRVEDTMREYLISRHIVLYHELPFHGPINAGLTNLFHKNIFSSPFYFYFLVALLSIRESLYFLMVVNILFQVIAMLFIYLITKQIKGERSALIASILFGFSETSLILSQRLGMLALVQPLSYFSLYLFLLFIAKKNIAYLISSIVSLAIAATFHSSAFVFIFIYCIALWFYLPRTGISRKKAAIMLFAFIVLFSIMNLEFFFDILKKGENPFLTSISNNRNFIHIENIALSLRVFLEKFYFPSISSKMLNGVFIGGMLLFLWSSLLKIRNEERKYLLFLILVFFIPIVLSLFLGPQNLSTISHYLHPIFGIGIILFVIFLENIFSKNLFKIPKFIIFLIFFLLLSPHFFTQWLVTKGINSSFDRKEAVVSAIENQILIIQRSERKKNFNFFSLQTYLDYKDRPQAYPFMNVIFWVVLEKDLNGKFTKVSSQNVENYEVINDTAYLFLNCYSYFSKEIYDCTLSFLSHNPKFKIVKEVYSYYPYHVYLLKRSY